MSSVPEVTCRTRSKRLPWFFVAAGAAGFLLVVARLVITGGPPDRWVLIGLLLMPLGVGGAYAAVVRVHADADGLSYRTLLRRRGARWEDIADVRVNLQRGRHSDIHRVEVVTRGGAVWRLPLPVGPSSEGQKAFDGTVEELRALHRRHGTPESDHLVVITGRTAGRRGGLPAVVCALFLAGAALAAWFVPVVAETRLAWTSAAPCAAESAAHDRDCLTTLSSVIARTEVKKGKGNSYLYFAGGRPIDRLAVSREGARGFEAGDRVRLTVWRGEVREVVGEEHAWREHFPGAGEVTVVAALCVLAAGMTGTVIVQRRRGRRLPADEVMPSSAPFAGAAVGTAVWALPYCYQHPTLVPDTSGDVVWAGLGSLASLALVVRAWRATRVRPPGRGPGTPDSTPLDDEDVFLPARFLESTDYNPNGFGTHIVLGADGPAVTPHPGPGRFAARPIPVERLVVRTVRRPRGGDGDTVPKSWDVAELDDGERVIRLAAAPAHLGRILRAFTATDEAAPAGGPGAR
ncbi:PH domain-containing protein [Streptomyces althioticus]|uniref:PH domain-containing protein n=1 Tax=Streptomyces althioticus TaxID=83380 RepID=UPI0038733DA8|nr:PH domain-containing protein [Streptomyces althioticus]